MVNNTNLASLNANQSVMPLNESNNSASEEIKKISMITNIVAENECMARQGNQSTKIVLHFL
jgi:hypothetical protein